jgi:hypothetical protein
MTYGKLTDSANGLQLDKLITGAVDPVPPVKALAVELTIADRAVSIDDQRELTRALGLDRRPAPPAHEPGPRITPDSFRRTLKRG